MTVNAGGRSFGANALLLLIAVILFVLAGFGAHISSFSEVDLVSFGLAFGFGSFLL